MSYNNGKSPRIYNTRNSGRFNRPATFTASTIANYQTYDVQNSQPPTPTRAAIPSQPRPQLESKPKIQLQPQALVQQIKLQSQPQSSLQPKPQIQLQPQSLVQQIQLQSQIQKQLQQKPQSQPQPENPGQQTDFDMTDQSNQDEEWGSSSTSRQPTPFKTKLFGIKKISNKERRRRQNALLRRLATPKNALMCINEMLPNEQITNQFKVELAAPDNIFSNNATPSFCAELELKGVNYKGYGDNKLSARNAAAEQAIRDIVLKKMERYSEVMAQQGVSDTEGSSPSTQDSSAEAAVDAIIEEDGSESLPMIQLLSFALHKLFAEWESAGLHVPQLRGKPLQANTDEFGASRPVRANPLPMVNKPRRPRKVPGNASSMHPAMLLTMLRPHATYRELASVGDKPQNMTFTFSVETDDKTFIGKASNKKEARKEAARAACKGILGLTFDDEKDDITEIN